jgi:hypothetical protein
MKDLKRFAVRAAFLLAAAATAAPAQAAEWTLLETEHFSLYTKRDDASVQAYLKQLEVFRWLSLKLLGADDKSLRTQGRFDIVLLDGRRALKGVFTDLPENTAGVYRYCAEGAMAYGTYDNRLSEGEDWNLIVLQHEYAHHLMFQYASISYPAWYVEGFAEYMATATYENGRISLGEANIARLDEWRRGGSLPFEEVLAWHTRSPKETSKFDRYAFYAQSWLLAHYMLSDNERTKKLGDYFARVGAGEDPVAAFEPATGIAVSELSRLLQRHSRTLQMLKVGGDDMPRPVVRGVKLGDDADAYLLEALELRTSQNEERGRAILGKLRALAPQPARAAARLRLALARAEARFGDPKAAVAMLDAQADAGPEAAETHYLLGRAWMRQAESLSGDEQAAARERARSHLFKAYRLKKDDAPTLYHLALALSRNGVDANALNAARAARGLAPSVPEYAVLEAQFDLQAGDAERAVRALGPLASDPHHPEQAARMRQAIAAIKDGKSLRDVASLMSEPPKKPTP